MAFLYTCPERRATLDGTLARWRATDWGEDPTVIVDDGTGPTSVARIITTARRMLDAAAAAGADYSLFLEDDLLLNLHLRHNLANWPPVRDGWLWMGSLYNPGLIPGDAGGWPDRHLRVAPNGYYGTQAFALSRAAIGTVLAEWAEPGPLDLKLAAIAVRHAGGVVVHDPSLVQQLPVPSAVGSGAHRAQNFDPFFRAEA